MNEIKEVEEVEALSEDGVSSQDNGSSEDLPILQPKRKKRRKRAYVDFAGVAKVFPEVSPKVACQLSEMPVLKPSKVLELVPGAKLSQIAAFLKIAEEGYHNTDDVMPKRGDSPELAIGTSQLDWLKEKSAAEVKQARVLSSPTEENSEFMEQLRKIIPPKEGGTENSSVKFSEKFQEKILDLLGSANPSKEFNSEHFEKVYDKLIDDPLARSRIENLHAARAHKYGHAHFGAKFWYKEALNLSKKFKSQADRRKFRIGLKGLVDFLNQLNIKDLEKLLQDGELAGFKMLKMPVPMSPEAMCSYLKPAPPIKIIECMNKKKAADILKLVGKIASLAHFSQSMAEYFARDDALEPALAAVCEVLRTSQDVGGVLEKRATSFMGLAQPFDKHRSAADRDACFKTDFSKRSGRTTSSEGLCWRFQKQFCNAEKCSFIHKCSKCGSTNHGESKCKRRKRRRKTSPSSKMRS